MNKVAVITGASRGIGKAIALKFATEGYNIVINYRGSEEKANQVRLECMALGVDALLCQGDVSCYEDMERLMKTAIDNYGQIDVLVNNSGITKDQLLLKMNSDTFMDVIDVNLKGTFHAIKAVTRIMMKQRGGVIINMASVIGEIGNAGQANYAASKAGIIGLTKSVAKELAPRHIRVNAIAPGFIATDMTDILDDKTRENILQAIPLNTLGEAQDVANMAYFLASDQAKYVTGQVINVDGGMVM